MNKYEKRMRELWGAPLSHPITLSEADLQFIESKLAASLPADYREFLRDYGCYFVEASFSIGNHKRNIELFYGLTSIPSESSVYGTNLDIVEIYGERSTPRSLLGIDEGKGQN